MARSLRIPAAICWLAALPVAQEPLRDRALGEVRGLDNQPFAKATVHLLHRACTSILDPAYQDLVEVTADVQGRFQAQVLAGMPYAVWATGPIVDGTYRCTKVLIDVVPGIAVVLREDELHFVRKCTVTVDPSWRALRFAASASIGGMLVRQPLVPVEGAVSTPAWPVPTCAVAALAGELAIGSENVPLTVAGMASALSRRAPEAPVPGATEIRKQLAEPAAFGVRARQEYALRFLGPDKKPAPGISVFSVSQQAQILLGTTGDDGIVRVRSDSARFAFYETIASGEGCAETRVEWESFRKVGEAMQDVVLAPGNTTRGRLLLGDKQPAGPGPLLQNGSIAMGAGGTYFGIAERTLRTTAEGGFSVTGRVPGYQFRLTAVLTPAQRMELSGERKAPPLWPRALAVCERAQDVEDLGDVRLDRLVRVDVHVAAADGSPPGSVQLVVVPLSQGGCRPHYPERMRTDRHGALRFLLDPDAQAAVFAVTAGGAAMALVGKDARGLELKIDPRHVLRVRIVDPGGKPMAGARVDIASPKAAGLAGDPLLAARVQETFSVHGFPFKYTTADADGQAVLVSPLLDVTLDLCVYGPHRPYMRVDVPLAAHHPAYPSEITFVPNRW